MEFMIIVGYIILGIIGYLLIGNIIACCMKLAGHHMTTCEDDFKVIIALWPAPVALFLAEGLVTIITLPFGRVYKWMEKWK